MIELSTSRSDWPARLAGAFWFALILFAGAGLLVVGTLPAWMIAVVLGTGAAAGVAIFLLRRLARRRTRAKATRPSLRVLVVGGMLVATGLAALPIYYLAYWVQSGPIAVPLATLSNGKKTVVFQGMQHIGSEDFYKSVVFDLEQALVDGYTLFYEGVQQVPGRPDLTEWFQKTVLGANVDLSEGYTRLADECGLKFQLSYFQLLLADQAIHPSRHTTADVSYADLKAEYDRLVREDTAFAAAMTARAQRLGQRSGDDPMLSVLGAMRAATPAQKKLIGIACRGLLGMAASGRLSDKDDPMARLVLDYRNRVLARLVAESRADRIYITYGAAHFPGFVAELQRLDPAFTLRAVKGVRPMALPDEVNLPPSAVFGPAR